VVGVKPVLQHQYCGNELHVTAIKRTFHVNKKSCDIVFSIRASPFSGISLYCIFVRNTIYVIKIEMLIPVVLARNHKFDSGSKSSIFGNLKCSHIIVNQASHFLPD
jgi:hypothetical protein